MTVTLDQLRAANIKRQAEWPGGEHIQPNFRGLELAGEAGELANLLKKLARIELGIKGTTEDRKKVVAMIEEEIGDVAICIDLIGMQLAEKIDLKKANVAPVYQADPATFASDLCDLGGWLFSCCGDVSGSLSFRDKDTEMPEMLATTWNALTDVALALRLDVMKCVQLKFNMTSRKHGFKTMLGDQTV